MPKFYSNTLKNDELIERDPHAGGTFTPAPMIVGFNNRLRFGEEKQIILQAFTADEQINENDAIAVSDGSFDLTRFDINSTGAGSHAFGGATTSGDNAQRFAQSIVLDVAITLKKAKFSMRTIASPSDSVVVAIQADSGGSPSGTDLGTATVAAAGITSSFTQITFTFATAVSLSAATTYWIVFRRSGALNDTDLYGIEQSGNDVYAGGRNKAFDGSSWITTGFANTDYDIELIEISITGRILQASAAANNARANNFIGFAQITGGAGDPISGIVAGTVVKSGIVAGSRYYLSDTLGAISTTVGTVTRKVGIATVDNELTLTNIW